MNDGRSFWDELVYRYQMGVEYVTWMRETWDSLQPYIDARRFSEVKAKLATHETDAANWRDTLSRLLAGVQRQGHPGGRRAALGQDRCEREGRSAASTCPPRPTRSRWPPARRRRSPSVLPADPAASYEIVSQAASVPGQAVVKVTKDDFFGPIVKNYVFNLVPDTTLKSLKVNNANSRPSSRTCSTTTR